MKFKIIVLLSLIFITVSCKDSFNRILHIKSNDTNANIVINIDLSMRDKSDELINILKFRFDQYLLRSRFDFTGTDLVINVANYKDMNELRELLEHKGEFRIVALDDDGKESDVFPFDKNEPFVDKVAVKRNGYQLSLNLDLKKKYMDLFSEFTAKHMGKMVSFIMDDVTLISPVVQDKISQGKVMIVMNDESVEKLMLYRVLLLSGSLPFSLDQSNMEVSE